MLKKMFGWIQMMLWLPIVTTMNLVYVLLLVGISPSLIMYEDSVVRVSGVMLLCVVLYTLIPYYNFCKKISHNIMEKL